MYFPWPPIEARVSVSASCVLFSCARKHLFLTCTLLYDLLISERNYPASNVSKFNFLCLLKLKYCKRCSLKYCAVPTRALLARVEMVITEDCRYTRVPVLQLQERMCDP